MEKILAGKLVKGKGWIKQWFSLYSKKGEKRERKSFILIKISDQRGDWFDQYLKKQEQNEKNILDMNGCVLYVTKERLFEDQD
mgnify:CR=1 FL=1